jgi:hypothetical protein
VDTSAISCGGGGCPAPASSFLRFLPA